MLLEIGNPAPAIRVGGSLVAIHDGAPAVTYVTIPEADEDGLGGYTLEPGLDVNELARHILTAPDGITHLPDHEAILVVAHQLGLWGHHSLGRPSWIEASAPDQTRQAEMERLVSEFFGCPIGAPANLEDTHWTRSGMPGAHPDLGGGITALLTNIGRDFFSINMGGAPAFLGATGTATATTSTSLTGGTETGVSHASNDCVGQVVIAWASGAYGLVTGNTSGTTPVYTVDRWYVPATPGGSAASTPSSTTGYTVIGGGLPGIFMGLTATATSPTGTDTTLAGEITTAGGGLIRKICPMAHTAGAQTYTATPVFTANGTDSLPVTVAKMGLSASLLSGTKNFFQTLLSATATLSASGDQLTTTETVTTS